MCTFEKQQYYVVVFCRQAILLKQRDSQVPSLIVLYSVGVHMRLIHTNITTISLCPRKHDAMTCSLAYIHISTFRFPLMFLVFMYFLLSIMDTMMAPPSLPRPPPSPPPTHLAILLKKQGVSLQAPQAGPSNTKKCCTNKNWPKKPKKPHDWHLRKGDIPEDSVKTKAHRKFYNICSCPYPPFRSHLSSTYMYSGDWS